MPKIVHLVLYHDTPEYKPMYYHSRELYRAFEFLGVETWYYRYNAHIDKPSFNRETMIMELPGTESYIPGILNKTLDAFQVCVERGFQLLIRSNVSTIVNFPSLLECYENIQDKDMLYGGPHIMHSAENKDLGAQIFAQGTCMVFSPKVIDILLQYRHDLCQTAEDDYSIGALLLKHNIPLQQVGRQYHDYSMFRNIHQVSAYRNHDFHSDRQTNIANIRLEVNALFQRYVFLREPKQVKQVLYFNRDVTYQILKMCKQHTEWTTTQNNIHLDTEFGDPSPNLNKNLMVYFAGDTVACLTQRCNLTFFFKNNELFVR